MTGNDFQVNPEFVSLLHQHGLGQRDVAEASHPAVARLWTEAEAVCGHAGVQAQVRAAQAEGGLERL